MAHRCGRSMQGKGGKGQGQGRSEKGQGQAQQKQCNNAGQDRPSEGKKKVGKKGGEEKGKIALYVGGCM